MSHWFYIPINPEPWAIGPLHVGKKNGKFIPMVGRNSQLDAFKQAVGEHLTNVAKIPPGEYQLRFFFWRRLESYETQSGRRHQKHIADATNLQKACEDALQDILIDNDRGVRDVRSVIVEQGADVDPKIILEAKPYEGFNPDDIPMHMWEAIDSSSVEIPMGNEWPPRGAEW